MVDVSLKKKAHDLLQKGKLDSALRVFQAILREDPEDASVYNSAGDVLLKMKKKDEALEYFSRAAELYLRDGLHMVALSVSRKALRAEPSFGLAHYVMGVSFEEQNKPDQARREYILYLKTRPEKSDQLVISALTSLTRLDPEDRNWVIRLAKVAFVQKKEGVLDRCVSLAAERGFPEHRKMVQMLTELRSDARNAIEEPPAPPEEPAVPEEEPAGESEPEPEPESQEESQLEQVTFDSADFVEPGEEEAGTEPEEIRPRKRIGEYFVADGLLKASDVLKGLEVQASSREYRRLGDVLVEMGLVSVRQVREALSKQVADMKHRLERAPGDALGYVELGNLLLDVSDFYGAVEAYLKAAEVYRGTGREKMVFELLEGVLDICPESLAAARELVRIRNSLGPEGQARSLYRLAVAYLLNDSPHEAVAALEASVQADPNFSMAVTLLEGVRPGLADVDNYADIASILADIDRMFDVDSARALAGLVREFQEGIKAAISTDDFSTHYDLGIAYREMGLLREAVDEFDQVLSSPEFRVKAREMLGRCFLDMGRFDEAEEQFQKGMSLAGKDGTSLVGFHLNLAKVYEATGRKRQAEAERKAAGKIDPVLATIQDTLE
jgi:tetratricopeptide (TPR) repeat protein